MQPEQKRLIIKKGPPRAANDDSFVPFPLIGQWRLHYPCIGELLGHRQQLSRTCRRLRDSGTDLEVPRAPVRSGERAMADPIRQRVDIFDKRLSLKQHLALLTEYEGQLVRGSRKIIAESRALLNKTRNFHRVEP